MPSVDILIWQKIIEKVVADGGHLIRPWFTQLEPISLDHGLLEIEVPGKSERDYCRSHAAQLFTESAQKATGMLITVSFLAARNTPPPPPAETEKSQNLASFPVRSQSCLADDYTFENFVIGPCNRLANAASLSISESPGKTYNPLFIYGDSGLGKTHLIQAICQKVKSANPDAIISYLSCETFVNFFIEAVEQGRLHEFRYRYRHSDVLAIDDIQFLSKHEQTQEEFFHTFNTLYQTQKQIILTSDRSPSYLPHLEERLKSRFSSGLVARVDRPCYETRVAILKKKSRIRGIELPDDVICFIAASIESNTRELEGAISKVAMLAKVNDKEIDLSVAEQALTDEPLSATRETSIEDIFNAVTTRFNVRLADLQSRKRSRSITVPRQICMFLARNLTRHSLEEIGGYFGGRDHATVLHAIKTVEKKRGNEPQFKAKLDRLAEGLQMET